MMHGGMLQLEIWKADYKDAVAELDKIDSQIGNVGGDEEDKDEGEDEHEDEEGKLKKSKEYDETIPQDQLVLSMDVDDDIEEKQDNDGDTEEDERLQMLVDEDDDANPKKSQRKKASKLKPRKFKLDFTALSQEQAVLTDISPLISYFDVTNQFPWQEPRGEQI